MWRARTHTHRMSLSHKKTQNTAISSHTAEPETIILGSVSQRERQAPHGITYTWNQTMPQAGSVTNRNRLRHREQLTVTKGKRRRARARG